MKPRPCEAATSSAATSVDQPAPSAIRIPVRMSGSALGSSTWVSTCRRVAPNERAALIWASGAERMPAAVEIAIGASMASPMTRILAGSPMPNQMMTSGR